MSKERPLRWGIMRSDGEWAIRAGRFGEMLTCDYEQVI